MDDRWESHATGKQWASHATGDQWVNVRWVISEVSVVVNDEWASVMDDLSNVKLVKVSWMMGDPTHRDDSSCVIYL